uniref:Uncharacterized protein n=1 Tax=Sus scrofa TaxID=9823 RepID=A0A4X1UGT1_PIG
GGALAGGGAAASGRRSLSRERPRRRRARGRASGNIVAPSLTLLLFACACAPGASPTTVKFPPAVLTGPGTHGIAFALSLQWAPFVLPSSQVASVPPGPLPRVRGLPLPSVFYSCGAHLEVLKVTL